MEKYQTAANAIDMMNAYANRMHRMGLRDKIALTTEEVAALIMDVMESKGDWMLETHKLDTGYDAVLPQTMTWKELCMSIAQLETLRNNWIAKATSTSRF